MLILSLALTSSVEACTQSAYLSASIASPRSGTITPGFAMRPNSGVLDLIRVEGLDGEFISFDFDAFGQALAPWDLPAGTYTVLTEPGLTLEVLDQAPEWVLPDRSVEVLDVAWEKAWVHEELSDGPNCRSTKPRRHTLETLTLDVPSSDQNGWAARITDSSTGLATWVALDEGERTVHLTQDLGSFEDQERCIQISLYDPQGILVEESERACEERLGCSSSTGTPALLGGLLAMLGLMGLRRRREMGGLIPM